MLENKKILVTGASGFLGRNLCKKLPQDRVVKTYCKNKIEDGWYCDLHNPDMVRQVFSKNPEINTIVHCAGDPSPKHPRDYEIFLDNHILSTINLLEGCPEKTHFIYISSVLVFGNEVPVFDPTNLYGACKLACEQFCDVYAKLKHLKVNIVRPCAITGSDLTHGLLFDIKRKLKEDTPELELFGNEPGTCKPYVHIDNVCRWILKCLEEDIPIPINCFPTNSITVKQVAEALMEKMNIHKPIKWLGESTIWEGDNRMIDTRKLQAVFVQESSLDAVRNSV